MPLERRTDDIRWLVARREACGSWFLFFHESLAEPCHWESWDSSLPTIRRQAHAPAGGELGLACRTRRRVTLGGRSL